MGRRGENIYKRKDGRYEGRYIKEYDATGKARYGAVYAKTYADAKEKLIAAKSKKAEPVQQKKRLTVANWFDSYLSAIRIAVKPGTYAVYARYIKNHIAPILGGVLLAELSAQRLQSFAETLTNRGLAPRTVHAVFRFLGEGLREAARQGYCTAVCSKVHLPQIISQNMRVFSLEEQRALERAARREGGNQIGVFLCLYTGLRLGEVCGLMWEDIDFQQGTLCVQRTLQRIAAAEGQSKTKLAFLPPKSNASRRTIPLPAFVLEQLKEYRATCGKNSVYVLHNRGKTVDPRTYQYQFQRLLKKAGIAPANFHALRHTFATRALEKGFDVKTLSELLGHRSAAVTLERYAHSLNEHKRSRMELLSELYETS